MYFTAFFPFFAILVAYSFRGPNHWAFAMAVACFFQSASPVLVAAGGRVSGIAPAFVLMFVGLCYVYGALYVTEQRHRFKMLKAPSTIWLFLFVVVGVAGALALPRLFEGAVRVLPPREGLDSGFTVPLAKSGTNYIQAFYLLCVFFLFASLRFLIEKGVVDRSSVIKGICYGAGLSVLLGTYQVLAYHSGLPWPASVLNSNIGVAQLLNQTAFGIKRMSATFLEPSQMSMHFLGAFGLIAFGLRRKVLGLWLMAALVMSTSSTAYVGLALLLLIWISLDLPTRARKVWPVAILSIVVIGIGVLIDQIYFDSAFSDALLFNKIGSASGQSRLYADELALRTLFESFGLGAGVGSARASSLPATLLATVGIPGFVCFSAVVWVVLAQANLDKTDDGRAVFFGLIGLLIGWGLSIPDLNFPLFWLLAAVATGVRQGGVRSSDKEPPFFNTTNDNGQKPETFRIIREPL